MGQLYFVALMVMKGGGNGDTQKGVYLVNKSLIGITTHVKLEAKYRLVRTGGRMTNAFAYR